ncbi:MAG: enoyl-CoA hydratase/isomerase family protein [Gammaproteobacteria bacterium]|nr:enoyl-CoA hydratase/isomerase family protein [Gammaproteobacteria bacterium]
MSNEDQLILFRVEDNVGIITLNRPDKLNAVSWELAEELAALLYSLRDNDEVRAIVLTGAGRAFCAGGDVDWISGDTDRPMPGTSDPSRPIPRYQRKSPGGPFVDVVRQIVAVEKPVIAAVHGAAVGAGLGYALACDRRFGDSTTKMSAIFTKIGMAPDCGISYFLPRLVGFSNALMLVETAKMVAAEECRELGLLDELLPEDGAFDAALAYAKTLASRASVAVDMARRLIHMSQTHTLEQMLDYEAVVGTMVASTLDAKEGTAAFLQKRDPVYRGV